uniref:EKC/KEOPS complex subunit GON7 n=1 Tax=Arion vulgaris TaxID=1028688 RepID=A0A0B6ZJL9_9EUPU
MATTTASLTINFKDGSSRTISHPVCQHNDTVRYDQLQTSLSYIQKESNSILTTLINQETANKSNAVSRVDNLNTTATVVVSRSIDELETDSSTGNDEDDDDEEDDDNADTTEKPPEKKRKTK